MLRNHVSASSRSPACRYAMAFSQSVCSCCEGSSMESGKGDTVLRTGPLAAGGIATSAVVVAGAPGSVGVKVGTAASAVGVGVSGMVSDTGGGAGGGAVKLKFCVESGRIPNAKIL